MARKLSADDANRRKSQGALVKRNAPKKPAPKPTPPKQDPKPSPDFAPAMMLAANASAQAADSTKSAAETMQDTMSKVLDALANLQPDHQPITGMTVKRDERGRMTGVKFERS